MDVHDIPEIITSAPTYEETLKMVKEIDPVAILPGQDIAVNLYLIYPMTLDYLAIKKVIYNCTT